MNKIHLLLLSAVLYLLTACSAPRLALTDASWANTIGYAVEGRTQTVLQKKPLRFAEFFTTKVKTSSTQSSSVVTDMDGRITTRHNSTVGWLYERSKSSRKFTLSNGKGQEALVLTFNQLNSSSYLAGGGIELNYNWMLKSLGMDSKTENSYYVQVYEPDADTPWELMLDMDAIELNPKNYAGYFAMSHTDYYTIKAIRHVMGKNGPSKIPVGLVGYEICDQNGQPVAAVSVMDKGVVYLQDTLPPHQRFLMASLCAALLLQEPNS